MLLAPCDTDARVQVVELGRAERNGLVLNLVRLVDLFLVQALLCALQFNTGKLYLLIPRFNFNS